jgi:predicted ATPase
MRITRLRTENVGGLQDSELDFPDQQMLAFAGANGTGKSKLLSCLLAPWTQTLPPGRHKDQPTRVDVTIQFEQFELDVLEEFDKQMRWGGGRPPETVTATFRGNPFSGISWNTVPENLPAAVECFRNQELLARAPSLNLVYLPAERRLLPSRSKELDLSTLAEDAALLQLARTRNTSTQNYGRLDDEEFESYAKALCVAGSLPSEFGNTTGESAAESRWDDFKSAVDQLLYPKTLKALTRENPSELYIQLPDGNLHLVHDLSSGERQALIILSRVFRAGEGHSLIAIDEPDAFLHPSLSTRLLNALKVGLGPGGRMFVATHSPVVLDAMPPEAIIRLSYRRPPQQIDSETDRLDLYRAAGFRASALTQADLLVSTEGESDATILPQLMSISGAYVFRSAGGRAEVLKAVGSLHPFDVPVIGVIDADVDADKIPEDIRHLCMAWSSADIEGVLLSSEHALAEMIEGSLVKPEYRNLEKLKETLTSMLSKYRESAIAEIAQRKLRNDASIKWTSPRGPEALDRLRSITFPTVSSDEIEQSIAAAEKRWEESQADLWRLVRGKWLLPDFVREATSFKNADGFISALAARQPQIADIEKLAALATARMR